MDRITMPAALLSRILLAQAAGRGAGRLPLLPVCVTIHCQPAIPDGVEAIQNTP